MKKFNRDNMIIKNPNDPRLTSITYGFPYPISDENIDEDRKDLNYSQKNLTFSKPWKHISKCSFNYCRVKYLSGASSELKNTYFHSCKFEKCFLGGTTYANVKFIDCQFSQCDFQNAKFIKCSFTGCKFENISAWDIFFETTTISAKEFMNGVIFKYNDNNISKELSRKLRFHKTNLDITSNLIKSTQDTFDQHFIDISQYEYKLQLKKYYKFKIQNNINDLSYGNIWKNFFKILNDFASLVPIYVINAITNGGTSFKVLFIALIMGIFGLFPIVLSYTTATQNFGSTAVAIGKMGYWGKVLVGIEAFMGFGYTSINQSNLTDKLLLILLPTCGLVVTALLLHTFIKKVYR